MALKFEITGDNKNFLDSLDGARNGVRRVAQDVESSGMSIEDMFKRIAAAAGAAFTLDQAKRFVNQVMTVRGQFQQLEIAFSTMLQSEEKAKALMDQLVETAAKTPFDLKGVAEGAKQLLAYGIQAEEVNETITRLGDIAAGLSIPLGDLVYLYGTTMTQGRMFTMDLRQFMGRGIPMAEELAKQFGVAKEEVAGLVTAGKVSAEAVKNAIWGMTDEGTKFGGLMEKQSASITGQISNIQDAIDNMFNDIGQQNEGLINSGLEGVSYLIEHYETIGKILLQLLAIYGSYKAAVIAYVAIQKVHAAWIALEQTAHLQNALATEAEIAAKGKATVATVFLDKVNKALNATMLANPYVMVAAGIMALASAFYLFGNRTDEATEAQKRFGEAIDKVVSNFRTLYAVITTTSKSSKVHKDAVGELSKAAEDYGVKIDKEKDLTDQLIIKKDELIAKIKEEAREREKANQISENDETYTSRIEELRKSIQGELGGALNDYQKNYLVNTISQEDLEKLGELYEKLKQYNIEVANGTKTMSERKEVEMEIGAYKNKIIDQMALEASAMGSTTEESYKFSMAVKKNSNDIQSLIEQMGIETRMYNSTNKAIEEANIAYMNNQTSLDGTTMSVEMLQARTAGLLSLWNNAHPEMTFKIHFDDSEIPAWMKGLTTEQLKKSLKIRQDAMLQDRSGKGKSTWGGRIYGNDAYTAGQTAMLQSVLDSREAAKNKPTTTTPKGTGGKGGKRGSGNKWDKEEKKKERERQLQEWEEDLNELVEQLFEQTTDNQLDLMGASAEKEREKLRVEHEKNLKELDDEKDDLIKKKRKLDAEIWANEAPNRKAINFKDERSDEKVLEEIFKGNENLRKAFADREDAYNATYLKKEKDLYDNELSILYDFLEKYGDYQEKRLAIEKKYALDIENAASPTEKAGLMMERDEKLEELNKSNFEESIDWEGVFSDLKGHTKEYLTELRDQLQGVLKEGTLAPDKLSVVQDKINDINEEISKQNGLFQFQGDRAREHTRLMQEASDAEQAKLKAEKKEAEAENNVKDVTSQIRELLKKSGIDEDVDIEEGLKSQFDVNSEEYKKMDKLLSQLSYSERKLAKAREETGKATNNANKAEDKAKRSSAQSIADWFSDAQQFITEKGIDQIPDLLNSVGLESLGEKATKGLSAFNDAAGAFADYASGNYVGAAMKGINAINTFGETLGLWSNSNVEESEAEIDKLTKSNAELGKALDNLRDELKNINISDTSTYEKAKEVANAQIANAMRATQTKMAEYSGHHSTNYYSGEATQLLKALAENAMGKGIIDTKSLKGVGNINELLKLLSPDELSKLRTFDPQGWIKFMEALRDADKANLGAADSFLEYVDTYSDLMDELEKEWKETVTNLSWDSLKSSFASALEDMEKDVDEWSNDLEDIFRSGVSNYLSTKYTDKETGLLAKWYEKYFEAMQSGNLDADEIAELRRQYLAIVQEATEERDKLYETLGLVGSKDAYQQEASKGGWGAMSEDTAGELNGRFTALQMSGERISEGVSAMLGTLATLSALTEDGNITLVEIRNLMITNNAFLEDILSSNKEYYKKFNAQLDKIVTQTK